MSTPVFRGTAVTAATYELAEGILWDDRAECARWVDIWKGRVLAGELRDGRLVTLSETVLGQTAGAVGLAEDGGLIVAAARGLATISRMGEVSLGPDLLGSRGLVRLNDGSVDPNGAFVVGTASLDPASLAAPAGKETLLRVWPDGRVETLRTGIRLSNGIAFSPNGGTIYHVDTYSDTVSSHSYGAQFDHHEPWQAVLTDLPGHPDGLTVDAEGALWVALWGASRVQRHAPTGELLATVNLDAGQVSCPGFVGPDFATLAITTGQEGLEVVNDQTGAILIADVGVRGIPAHRWRGSTTTPYWLNQAPKQEHA